jgi:serine protease Do
LHDILLQDTSWVLEVVDIMAHLLKMLTVSAAGFIFSAAAVAGGTALVQPTSHPSGNVSVTPPSQTPPTLPIAPDTISDVVKRDGPAVVKIVSTNSHGTESVGSGFIVTAGGDLLTSDDIVFHSHVIKVFVSGYAEPFTARTIGTDYLSNLAVLKISGPNPLPTISLGSSSETPVGAWAIAIGNPYNLSNTVTVGVVSATGRSLAVGNREYLNLLQTSAAINPGNSGGPLLNLKGQVIGINTVVPSQGQGIGFAIPVCKIKRVFSQILQYGHALQPWLGILGSTDSGSLAAQYHLAEATGVAVASVVPHSGAWQAHLKAGDVITAVNGHPITRAAQLAKLIDQAKIGQKVMLTVVTAQRISSTVPVTLQAGPSSPVPPPEKLF